MNVGEPMAVPIIRQLKAWVTPQVGRHIIVDCPPGTSCPAVASIQGSDFLLLVTEPTPFGLHDLRLAVQVGRELGISMGVIVSRDGKTGFSGVDDFCLFEQLPILLRIPFERAIAEGIAQGRTLVEMRPEYRPRLWNIFQRLEADGLRLSTRE
jgi:MinD superfamily P-loop ATPase